MSGDAYQRKKERERDRQRDIATAGANIAPIPAVVDAARRARAQTDFRFACETYFPRRFPLAWSRDHLVAIERIEDVVLRRELFALAMPRGSGKTTLCEAAILWAVVVACAHSYAALLAATDKHAVKRMAAIKKELLFNELLAEDFPEVCHPIRKMGGIANRTKGQHLDGSPTDITWGKSQIVLPTVRDSTASAAIIECGGLMTAVRGLNYTTPSGEVRRPSIALIDDPQTRRSARSETMSEAIETVLAGDVLYLPGPGQRIAALMPCTIIEPMDMAARMLDRSRNPLWRGQTTQAIIKWPTNMDLWERYWEMRCEEIAAGGDGRVATRFYKKHRKAMDAGAEVSWPERKSDDELSALQHCMNLFFRDQAAFMAEFQNDPQAKSESEFERIAKDSIAGKIGKYARGRVPASAHVVTCGIDIHDEILYWVAIAWGDGFNGWLIDRGSWPEQPGNYFRHSAVRNTLSRRYRGMGLEARIAAGLNDLLDQLEKKTWPREGGGDATVDGGLVDRGYKSVQVDDALRGRRTWIASHGKGITATKAPMAEWKSVKGESRGDNWRLRPSRAGIGRHVIFDANYWKTHLHERLRTASGDPGCLELWKDTPARHRMLAEHLASEAAKEDESDGRRVIAWTNPPGGDNHLFDCAVLCAVRASTLGVRLGLTPQPKKKATRRKRVSYL